MVRIDRWVSVGGLTLFLVHAAAMAEEGKGEAVKAPGSKRPQLAAGLTPGLAAYTPPSDNGYGHPPPTLASRAAGATADGSNYDVGYCHGGHCITAVAANYYNARKIRFNRNLINWRNDSNLHQVLARAFHPYYVTKDENFSTNDCLGGW